MSFFVMACSLFFRDPINALGKARPHSHPIEARSRAMFLVVAFPSRESASSDQSIASVRF